MSFIRRHDRKLRFEYVSLQTDKGKQILKEAGFPDGDTDTVVYRSGVYFYARSGAVLHILKDLGYPWKLLYSIIIVPSPVCDYFYRLIARHRHLLGGDKCPID